MSHTKPPQAQNKTTCTGTKKQKFWTSKCTKPAQGQKNKNFRAIAAPSHVDCEVFAFFGPGAGMVHFEVQNLCFFCPCAGLVHFEVQNPMHVFMCILILFLLLADILDADGIFCFPCSFLKGQVHFSCKGFTIWRLIWSFSKTDSVFRKLVVFLFEMSMYLKSYAFRMHFLPVFAVFLKMWSYWLYSYLVWWPPPQELESALGGWPYVYIYVYMYISSTLNSIYKQILLATSLDKSKANAQPSAHMPWSHCYSLRASDKIQCVSFVKVSGWVSGFWWIFTWMIWDDDVLMNCWWFSFSSFFDFWSSKLWVSKLTSSAWMPSLSIFSWV